MAQAENVGQIERAESQKTEKEVEGRGDPGGESQTRGSGRWTEKIELESRLKKKPVARADALEEIRCGAVAFH